VHSNTSTPELFVAKSCGSAVVSPSSGVAGVDDGLGPQGGSISIQNEVVMSDSDASRHHSACSHEHDSDHDHEEHSPIFLKDADGNGTDEATTTDTNGNRMSAATQSSLPQLSGDNDKKGDNENNSEDNSKSAPDEKGGFALCNLSIEEIVHKLAVTAGVVHDYINDKILGAYFCLICTCIICVAVLQQCLAQYRLTTTFVCFFVFFCLQLKGMRVYRPSWWPITLRGFCFMKS
jgi:hypothetical protein